MKTKSVTSAGRLAARANQHALVILLACVFAVVFAGMTQAQVAIYGDKVYPVDRPVIENGVVIIEGGKITAVGAAGVVAVPEGLEKLEAPVVVPGLVDAHTTVGVSGVLNYDHDQDQLERSAPIQPELRALDAYNCREPLVEWVRSFGVTTLQTGHAPGELISGQLMIVKSFGRTVDDAAIVPSSAVAATLASQARKSGGKSPGTRGKMMAMLRQAFLNAQAYAKKQATADDDAKEPDAEGEKKDKRASTRSLSDEVLVRVLKREIPLLVTAHRAQDIANALRLAVEFDIRLILDGAAEAYLLVDRIRAADVPVLIHPPMVRAYGDLQNMSFETASTLINEGVKVAFQSGYESYVPKTRVLLFEAGIAAANGLSFDQALRAITLTPAEILGIDQRVGSLTAGKDGDVALYDGDPFEYTTHCVAVVGEGRVIFRGRR
ncbi:MAG: amidohydrolase family protein [Phycisphaerae bacterium]